MPTIMTALLIWIGTTLAYVVLRRQPKERTGAWIAAGGVATLFVVVGFVAMIAQSSSVAAGLAEATAHVLTVGSLLAVAVPLTLTRSVPRRQVRVTAGAGRVVKRPPRYGRSRIIASVVAAPVAATVAVLALPKILPFSATAGYLITVLLIVPAMAVAPLLVLTSPSPKGAWVGSATAAAVSLLVIATALV